MKRNFFKMAFVSLLALGALCSCSKDEDKNKNGAIQSNTLNVTVENAASYSGKISDVKLSADGSDVTLASAPYNNGKFTITLPESLGRQYLDAIGTPRDVTISDTDVKTGLAILYAYESGSRIGRFYHGAGDWQGFLMYADGDVSITGSHSFTNSFGGTTAETFNNCNLADGWNILYIKGTQTGSSDEYEYTTRAPAGAKWYFTAMEEDEEYVVIQNNILTIAMENPAGYTGKIDAVQIEVFSETDQEYIPLAGADYNSRGYTLINLPESLNSLYLYGLTQDDGRTVSDPDFRMGAVALSTYKSGSETGALYHGTENCMGGLLYADRDVSITGSFAGIYEDGDKYTEKYNMHLAEGWNLMYVKMTQKTGNSYEYEYATQAPQGAKWHFREYSSTSAALHKRLHSLSAKQMSRFLK
jgi:hypothetical protein